MLTVADLLDRASVKYEAYRDAGALQVYLTLGNQLVGTHATLTAFRNSNKHYRGWQAHHVFETHDLERMHVALLAPSRQDQLCVLFPERAHIGRINSILRRLVPLGCVVSPRALLEAYGDAYALVGDYCGGGELVVRRELVAIVEATLKSYQLL